MSLNTEMFNAVCPASACASPLYPPPLSDASYRALRRAASCCSSTSMATPWRRSWGLSSGTPMRRPYVLQSRQMFLPLIWLKRRRPRRPGHRDQKSGMSAVRCSTSWASTRNPPWSGERRLELRRASAGSSKLKLGVVGSR